MKLLISVVLLSSVYCAEQFDQDVEEIRERRIEDNYESSLEYGARPYMERRQFENENYYRDEKDIEKGDFKSNDGAYNSEFSGVGKRDRDEYIGSRKGRGFCIGEYRDDDGDKNGQIGEYNRYSTFMDDEVKERCDQMFGYTGPTANDEPENLVRPCALDDWQCIRKYFAANSNCKPAYGPIPDPLNIDVNTAFFTLANLTAVLTNMTVRGLSSAKISEFYYNKKSGNLVLAFDVTNLNLFIPDVYFRYRRTAKEPIVLTDFGTITFRAVTFTAVIPSIPKLRLDLADIHGDIRDSTPHIIGPGSALSADPDVATSLAEFNLFLPISINEGAFFQNSLFAAIYIQKNICDFGLKLISV